MARRETSCKNINPDAGSIPAFPNVIEELDIAWDYTNGRNYERPDGIEIANKVNEIIQYINKPKEIGYIWAVVRKSDNAYGGWFFDSEEAIHRWMAEGSKTARDKQTKMYRNWYVKRVRFSNRRYR